MIVSEGGGGVRGAQVLFFTIFKAYFVPSHPTTPLKGGWGACCFPRGIKLLFSLRGNKKKNGSTNVCSGRSGPKA